MQPQHVSLKKTKMKHWHHIVPKHAGGTDDPSNLVHLTVEEHSEAHRKLYEQYGRWQDKIAWQTLSGQIDIQEARHEMMKVNNPMHNPDVLKKMSGNNHWSKREGNIHNWITDNPMRNPEIAMKLSGDNHWSKRPGKIHNAKVNHPKGSSKKIMVNNKLYNSIKEASDALHLSYRQVKKIGNTIKV
jgi:hypothetical protein